MINQSNATLLFNGMLSLSIQTWTCVGTGESPSSAIRIPWCQVKMAADVLCQLDQNAQFPSPKYRKWCGAGFVQVCRAESLGNVFDCFFPQHPHFLGAPNPLLFYFLFSGSTPLSLLSVPLSQLRSSSFHLVTGLLSSIVLITPCLIPLLCILHKKCPKCYFFKWKYDHVPPLSFHWLPINLYANNTKLLSIHTDSIP